MNEEFGTLKDMVPACKGQEMHKLAILQAGIDYLRYLERCIDELKETETQSPHSTAATLQCQHQVRTSTHSLVQASDGRDREASPSKLSVYSDDARCSSASSTRAALTPLANPASSEVLIKSKDSDHLPSPRFVSTYPTADTLPSPQPSSANRSFNHEVLGFDTRAHEATTALLMLTTTDRRAVPVDKHRGWAGSELGVSYPDVRTGRTASTGMRVQDLLRTKYD